MPLLSIIVPIFNVEKYVSDCIKSILAQTYKDFELILVNDGSTDNSREICSYYAAIDDRVILIQKKNGGVSSARNEGMAIAKGKYIAFVDADDTIEPSMYEKLIEGAQKLDSDMVICQFKIVDVKKDNITLSKMWKGNNGIINQNIISNSFLSLIIENNYSFFSCWNKLYSASLFKDYKIKFEENKNHGEDVRLNLKLLPIINKIVYIEDPLYNYFIRDRDSLTSIFRENFYDYILDYRNLLLDICDHYNLDKIKKKVINKFVLESIVYMHKVVESDLLKTRKYEILSLILNSKEFHNNVLKCKGFSFYIKILQIICFLQNNRLFYNISKTKLLVVKLLQKSFKN